MSPPPRTAPPPAIAAPLRLTLRRTGAGIALFAVAALWLWMLPALVTRGGFVLRDSTACARASYRNPVTGRDEPARPSRIALDEACGARTSGSRP